MESIDVFWRIRNAGVWYLPDHAVLHELVMSGRQPLETVEALARECAATGSCTIRCVLERGLADEQLVAALFAEMSDCDFATAGEHVRDHLARHT